MKRFLSSILYLLAMACNVNAAILVFSPNGAYTTKTTISAALSDADTVGKHIVNTTAGASVSTALTVSGGRTFECKDGGYVTFSGSGSLTGLPYSEPGWFGRNTTPGTTDMTTAVSKACNSSKYVKLTEWYKTVDEITCAISTTIEGIGQGLSGVYAATLGANKAALKFTESGVVLKNFTVRGPSTATYVADENGIAFSATSSARKSNAYVSHVEVKNFGSKGISPVHYDDVTVSESHLHDLAYAGVLAEGSHNLKVLNTTIKNITPGTVGDAYGVSTTRSATGGTNPVGFVFDGNYVSNIASWEALDTHGGSNGVISNNVVKDCKIGINIAPNDVSHVASHDIVIANNPIYKGDLSVTHNGIIVGGYDASSLAYNIAVNGNTVRGMGFADDTGASIFAQWTDGLSISGGTLYNSATNGVYLKNTNTNFSIGGGLNINTIQPGIANAAGIGIAGTNTNSGNISGVKISSGAKNAVYVADSATGVTFGSMDITSSASPQISGGTFLGSGVSFKGTVTNDTASIASGGTAFFSITVPNSKIGDNVYISSDSADVNANLMLTGQVQANGTVYARLFNPTAGAIDPPSTTYTAVTVRP